MSRRLKKTKKIIAPVAPAIFDDALPAALKDQNQIGTQKLQLHVGRAGKLSPYIIHLSQNSTPGRKLAHNPVEELKRNLLLDSDLMSEAGELDNEENLLVDFQDLVAQLREPDAQVAQSTLAELKNETPMIRLEATEPSPIHDLVEMDVDFSELVDQPAKIKELASGVLPRPTPVFSSRTSSTAGGPPGRVTPPANFPDSEPELFALRFTPDELESSALQTKRQWLHFEFPVHAHVRALATFVLFSFALVLPLHAMQSLGSAGTIKTDISDAGVRAIDNLTRGAQALGENRYDLAGLDFARATSDFKDAEESLGSLRSSIASLVSIIPQTDRTYDSVRGLITAGSELSEAATLFSQAASEVSTESATNVVTKLNVLKTYIEKAQPHIELAQAALEDVDPQIVPADYEDKIRELQNKTPALASAMGEFITFSDTLRTILGEDRKMRYLVVFQNNTELRATGGFVGSFAEIDVLGGEIVDINIPAGGSYDVQGQLSAYVLPPSPLSLVNPRWEFHDANWFPDFPTSASKMMWFYEKSGGPTVDGVIAINATLMPDLLAILGQIEMPEYGRTIDSENFLFETQKIVEFEYQDFVSTDSERVQDAPKQFIGDLAPKLLDKIKDADFSTLLSVLDRLGTGLSEKDVLFYFDNNTLQTQMEDLGWSGSLLRTDGDYLMVVDTNLGGGKTDTVIEQNIDVQVDVEDDGSIINTITITKEHHGLKTTLFEGVNNVDYLRVYVPAGSQFITGTGFEAPPAEAFDQTDLILAADQDLDLIVSNESEDEQTGTDIWDEAGKTVFGNWIQTAPGETQTVTFSYRLPWKLTSTDQSSGLVAAAKARLGFKDLQTYTLFIQKQPGVETRQTQVSLNLPGNRRLVWGSEDGDASSDQISVSNQIDSFLRFLIEKLPTE